MLTEEQVERSFRRMVSNPLTTEGDFDRVEELLDQLRPESPLRFRLWEEMEQLRKLQVSTSI